jgi:short-subunit dehydrogenase
MAEEDRRRSLVTGASAGIGEAFARRLARDGYDVTLVARRRDRLDGLAGEIGREHGVTAEVMEADLVTGEGCGRVEEYLRANEIDVLVNNAGFGTFGEFHALPLEREVDEIRLNVLALVRLTHAALAGMVERGRGGVINLASMAAFQPIPHNATYAATKAYVLHFSEAVHEEVRKSGVTVTAVCPGPVRTEFQEVAGIDADKFPTGWTEVETVIDVAMNAMRGGRAYCIPGAVNQMMAASVRMAPRFMARQLAGSFTKRAAEGSPR